MSRLLRKLLNIYEDEVALFLWSAFLLFLVHVANILFNNTAETAFLKRYGVEYLPIVYMINAVSTFFIMGVLTGFMARMADTQLLSRMLVGSGALVGALRFVIPLGIDLLYPVLFVLKSQLEVLFALLFWNMANDLFNTRQSKRIFPLMTAGGVIGAILGSFATAPLARLIQVDNLLLVYFVISLAAAAVVNRMGHIYPTLLLQERSPKKKGKSRTSIIQEFKKIGPIMKESTLVRVLIVFVLMANIVITIINYQFNFAVNQAYATEGGMIKFFAVFRGFLNIISLVILLFVGKIYGKWGLPVALMIHPFNYILAFLAFLFRFDIYSAMYARISTNVLRTTINNPAMAVLMGLFHSSQRAVVRPFLRGTVVRIGTLLGSGTILLCGGLFHPRYLSIVAIACMIVWLAHDFILKKQYTKILLDLISRNLLDLKSLEDKDVIQVFRDKKMQAQVLESFLSSRGEDCIWYADLLRGQDVPGLDEHLLKVLRREDDKTGIGLLALLSPEIGKAAMPVFRELADPSKPELMVALLKTANRFAPETGLDFNLEVFEGTRDPEVKAYALVGLYRNAPDEYSGVIQSMLHSKELGERKAGVIAAGESKAGAFTETLRKMVTEEKDPSMLSAIFRTLRQLGDPELNSILNPYFSHSSDVVRLAAVDAFEIRDDEGLSKVIAFMGDSAQEVSTKAMEKIRNGAYQNPVVLVESLNIPRRKVREGLFQLLEGLNIKDLDVYRFARSQVEKSYACLAEVEALKEIPETPERDLLMDHLSQEGRLKLENILRVLSIQDASGQMRLLWRGISSADARQRSNSIEAMADMVDSTLTKILVPLLEDRPAEERLKVGMKHFSLLAPGGSKAALLSHLLAKGDWVTSLLTLSLMAKQGLDGLEPGIVETLAESKNPHIRHMARTVLRKEHPDLARGGDETDTGMRVPDKILRLKKIAIFAGLSVSEMAAIGSVTEEVSCVAGEVIIKEGEWGDTMYLIIDGDVSVTKEAGAKGGRQVELGRIGAGNYFGEMALFEDAARSATIRTVNPSRLLVLHKREFTEIVREYPQIALHICKALSERIRELHEKVKGYERQAR
ncbi:MAG: Npt1/Npt2 family nucleotide transporter [Pseudomonadota bacterium]